MPTISLGYCKVIFLCLFTPSVPEERQPSSGSPRRPGLEGRLCRCCPEEYPLDPAPLTTGPGPLSAPHAVTSEGETACPDETGAAQCGVGQ